MQVVKKISSVDRRKLPNNNLYNTCFYWLQIVKYDYKEKI